MADSSANYIIYFSAVKHRLTQAETEIKQFQIQIKHSKSELDTKLPLLKKTGMAFEKDRNDLQMKEAELKSLQVRIWF